MESSFDSLEFNPFSEFTQETSDGGSLDETGVHNYSSAVHPKHHARPSIRHRKSSSNESSISRSGSRMRHARSHTEVSVGSRSGDGIHPLRTGFNGTQDTGVTRPHLSRMVNTGNLVDAPTVDSDQPQSSVSRTSSAGTEERDVLVHEVTSNDSLAGVSLKYGIPLAELRRANQLWTTDTIHLRKVLYIPIDKATRAQQFLLQSDLILLTPDSSTSNLQALSSTPPITEARSKSMDSNDLPKGNICRVPASQLSFFPPSSTSQKASLQVPDYFSKTTQPRPLLKNTPNKPYGQARFTPSPVHSFTSILTALPIAASTRDDIIARLSFDSVSSSYTDSHRGSVYNEGHEMGDVTRRWKGEDQDTAENLDDLNTTPKATHRTTDIPLKVKSSTRTASLPRTLDSRAMFSTSPLSYIPHRAYVRTQQMEPSPGMQLPSLRSSTLGRSAGKAERSEPLKRIPGGKSRSSILDFNFGVDPDETQKNVPG